MCQSEGVKREGVNSEEKEIQKFEESYKETKKEKKH